MDGNLDAARLKAMVVALWRQGGMDALVKVMAAGQRPVPDRPVGYCTTFKYVVGRTPREMEDMLGFAGDSRLASGAEIYLLRPLPTPAQFELRAYTHRPDGLATDDPSYRFHPDYPPGLGAPQWELTGYPQSGLHHLAAVGPGQRFAYPVSKLPPMV